MATQFRDKYEGEDRRSPDLWKLKKEISVGDLIAFCVALSSVAFAFFTLDKRLAVLEDRQTQQVVIDRRQDDDNVRYQARIEESLRAINQKLDRISELNNRR